MIPEEKPKDSSPGGRKEGRGRAGVRKGKREGREEEEREEGRRCRQTVCLREEGGGRPVATLPMRKIRLDLYTQLSPLMNS